jgi:hypothetical protein
MSLDVYLEVESPINKPTGSGIFVRENGQMHEITREEWDRSFPGREPIVVHSENEESGEVFEANITHNLNRMASEAGIYECLWRPDEVGITRAEQLIAPLTAGLVRLKADPEHFKVFNPENGWGSYAGFVPWVEKYLRACEQYPTAVVRVSR